MSRIVYLTNMLSRLEEERPATCLDDCLISVPARHRAARQADAITMLRVEPHLAMALPIPSVDPHVQYWEARQFQDELDAIRNRPERPMWRDRTYICNGEVNTL